VLVVDKIPDLPITRVSRWCFNCYVVTGDADGLVVVDPGMPTIANDLAPLLTAPLASVTATHGHPDHISGAPLLASRHGASIHLPATTLTHFDDTTPRTPSAAKLARTWPLLFGAALRRQSADRIRPRPTHALEDGAPLAGASAWTCVGGSWLTPRKVIAAKRWEAITERVAQVGALAANGSPQPATRNS
jgi:glyoxylase-like metal-dependent hydrolase (beta-lactamase superfamily II)